jgi:colanic acid/amylovoran biosynthesis glycosyltransferase
LFLRDGWWKKKGLEYALRALAAFAKRDGAPAFTLTVVGDGPLGPSMRALAQACGIADRINWKGLLPLTALKELLGTHHALLAPSCTATDGDSEGGAPTVILEAQAMGLPVIATTHDDIPFVTVPGGSAFLAEERDVAGLVAALVKLVDHPKDWAAMGKVGRDHMAKHHDARAAIHLLEGHYRNLLK